MLGWFMKTLMFRDIKFVLVLSVFFEVLEVMFQHLLPNFEECWWDHLILDLFVCNLAGIVLGWTCIN